MASATGQELVGLKHPEIVHSAVVLVLKDEGFSLPTVPAQMARQTAEKLLEWNSENKAAWQSFSESLVNTLSTCFEKDVVLGRIGKQRERMWSRYHKVRTHQSFRNTWITFLKAVGCEADPIFYQFVTDSVMELLIKLQYPVVSTSSTDEVCLDNTEQNAVRYIAGYSIRSLKKKMGRLKLVNKDELIKCLEEMVENERSTHHSADWIKSVDRGGLVHVDDMTYTVFVEIELVTRRYLNSKSARDVNMSSIVELIMVDEDVLFSWSIVAAGWENETSEVLLRLIAKHFITLRGFSFAKSIMELYKKKVKQTVQKSKGLRKQLQNPKVTDTDN